MKNKKILSLIFSGILSVGVVTPILSSYVNLHDVNKNKLFLSLETQTRVNYKQVEKQLVRYQQNKIDNNVYEGNSQLTPEQIQKIIEIQNEYFNLFKSKNYSLEQIHSYMCEKFPKYKEQYEKSLNDLMRKNIANKNASLFNSFTSNEEKIKEQVDTLWVERGVLIGATATFSALAAGFWAAAFWTCGATIPWAISCTTITAQIGSTLGCLCALIDRINEYINHKISKEEVEGQIRGLKIAILVLSNSLNITGYLIPGGAAGTKVVQIALITITASIDIIFSII